MRVRLFHWKAAEAAPLIRSLTRSGHSVEYEENLSREASRSLRESPPDAVVIDLTRLPSQGREVATYLRGSKATRAIPLVFVDGVAEKVESIRALLPDAVFSSSGNVDRALVAAINTLPANPVVPTQMMDRYGDKTAAQKLGIKPGMKVGVFDAPRNYEAVLGPLPEGAILAERAAEIAPVTLWFVVDPDKLGSGLRAMARRAGQTKLWILWRKGKSSSAGFVNEQFLRESALAVGLVDYKVCRVDDAWSALAFARKKSH